MKTSLPSPTGGRVGVNRETALEWLTQHFELSRGGAGHNVRSMEGLRGFAVFLVFLVHYVTLVNPWVAKHSELDSFSSALHTIGNSGVDLFFVLSGYLIYGSLISRPQRFFRFMSRRVKRIYPAFLVVFVMYLGLSFVFPSENKIPGHWLTGGIYLLQNLLLLPGLYPVKPMITVAWSLSYEIFYYLTIPLVIAAFDLRKRSVRWRVTFFAIIAIATVTYGAAYGGPVRMIMFLSGVLLSEAITSRGISPPDSIPALLALVAGLLALLLPLDGTVGHTLKIMILFSSFFILCLSCFAHPTAWLPQAFSWMPMRWFGNMSYSYYLLHGLTLKAGFLAVSRFLPVTYNGTWVFWVLLPVMFALTLIPTVALFIFVERPFSLAPAQSGRGKRVARHYAPD